MNLARTHAWPTQWSKAAALQTELSNQVAESDAPGPFRLVAGADISYNRGDDRIFAAVVVLALPNFTVVERTACQTRATLPYRPGFLSFRELPPLIACFQQLHCIPDVVICDGHGRAHPRRFGLACHLGWWLDIPTVGCAKSRLIGTFRPPSNRRGAHTALRDPTTGDLLGRVLRTRSAVAPVFVSTGHRILLDQAVRLVLRCCPRFRVPEPTRHAHHYVNQLRRSADPPEPDLDPGRF
ncbi:MAG: deoxyribonuclease V [Verrucomicrobiota bacterium]|jgi:deoxyribonuclease V